MPSAPIILVPGFWLGAWAWDEVAAALRAFAAIDEIALVAAPGITDPEIQTAILDHCESPFLQDRFAILDGKPTTTLTKAEMTVQTVWESGREHGVTGVG